MQIIYEAHSGLNRKDFPIEADARAWVELNKVGGYVVTFVKGFDGRDRSCAMSKFEDGKWVGLNIHE